jgi:hypothetical protein
MTNKELAKLYKKYNTKYFDGKLPAEIPVQLIDMSATDKGGLCTTYSEPGLVIHSIHLDSTFKDYDQLLKFFLLHEMVHVKLHPDDGHEQTFDDEMMRLAFRGAFKGIW